MSNTRKYEFVNPRYRPSDAENTSEQNKPKIIRKDGQIFLVFPNKEWLKKELDAGGQFYNPNLKDFNKCLDNFVGQIAHKGVIPLTILVKTWAKTTESCEFLNGAPPHILRIFDFTLKYFLDTLFPEDRTELYQKIIFDKQNNRYLNHN